MAAKVAKMNPPRSTRVRGYRWWVAFLLVLFAGQATWRAAHQSATWDEGGHLGAGYSYWAWGDYRVATYNFVFAQKLAASPLLLLKPNFPARPYQSEDCTLLGAKLLYESGNDPQRLLLASRLMIVAVGTALGLLVAGWARHIFGDAGALVSLGFFAFEPNLLAHSSLVSTDIVNAAVLLGLTWSWWALLHRCDLRRLLCFAVLLTLMLVTKFSFVVFAAVAGVLLAGRLAIGRELIVAWPGRGDPFRVTTRQKQIFLLAAASVIAAFLAWVGIWAVYGFRATLPDGILGWDNPPPGTLTNRALTLVRSLHVLPEEYLHDFTGLRSMVVPRPTFIAGLLLPHGVHWYFPLMFALKTAVPFLAGIAASIAAISIAAARHGKAALTNQFLYECLPVVVLAATYAASACASTLNLGVRHILPCYAAAAILCGILPSLLDFRRVWQRLLFLTAILWTIESAAVAASSPLAYFNEFAGGPARGSHWAVDSSCDWGGELPALATWLKKSVPPAQQDSVYLAYFGTAQPDAWGVRAKVLEGTTRPALPFGRTRWQPGWYIFSATLLRGGSTGAFGWWTRERETEFQNLLARLDAAGGTFADEGQSPWLSSLAITRLAAKLRSRTPDALVAANFFAFHFSEAETEDLLFGSPPALSPTPYSR
jgi:hypothetical protein